jgi:hypothetical protein
MRKYRHFYMVDSYSIYFGTNIVGAYIVNDYGVMVYVNNQFYVDLLDKAEQLFI